MEASLRLTGDFERVMVCVMCRLRTWIAALDGIFMGAQVLLREGLLFTLSGRNSEQGAELKFCNDIWYDRSRLSLKAKNRREGGTGMKTQHENGLTRRQM